jgi:hypothetical protein
LAVLLLILSQQRIVVLHSFGEKACDEVHHFLVTLRGENLDGLARGLWDPDTHLYCAIVFHICRPLEKSVFDGSFHHQ